MIKEYLEKYIILFIISFFAVIALCTLSYLTVLNYSYEMNKAYVEVSNDEIIGELEYSLGYGKKLENFYGLSERLYKGKQLLDEKSYLIIEDKNGNALASSEGEGEISVIESDYIEVNQAINDETGVVGHLITYFPKAKVREELIPVMKKTIYGCGILFVLLILVFFFMTFKRPFLKRRAILIIMAGIIAQGFFFTGVYSSVFMDETYKTVESVAEYLKISVEEIEEKGITINEIYQFDEFLAEKGNSYDWIDSIEYLQDSNVENNKKSSIVIEIGHDKKESISVNISNSYVMIQVLKMVLTFLATIIIAVIFMFELFNVSDMVRFKKSPLFNKPCSEQYESISNILRLSNFLTSTFSYMCLSFSALQIKEWNQGCIGMTPEIASAFSISICSIAEAAGMIVMPIIARKVNGKHILIISTSLLICSNFACFLTNSTMVILIMRFFAGLGFAGNKQVSNMMIANGYELTKERQLNLTQSNAGIIGGILCGMGFGSILAGVFGYAATFLGAGIGCIAFLLFNLHLVPWKIINKKNQKEEKVKTFSVKSVKAVLKSAIFWKQSLLIVMPQYLFLMVIITLIPGRIQSAGIDAVALTYCNLLNGIFGLYLGIHIQRFLEKRFYPMKTLILLFIIGIVSILIINIPLQVLMLLISSILAGIVDGVGTPLTAGLFVENRDLADNFDEDTILMLYAIIGCISMAVAPIILELCEKNILWMIGTCGVLAGVCVLLSDKRKKDARMS